MRPGQEAHRDAGLAFKGFRTEADKEGAKSEKVERTKRDSDRQKRVRILKGSVRRTLRAANAQFSG
jgi:hypothetical protein